METVTLNLEMIAVLSILVFTVFLFVSEIVRIDVAAILIMILIGSLSFFPAFSALANPEQLFDGFSSNAVISIIAVMIIGAGLDNTGIMSKVAKAIVRVGGNTETRLVPIISGTVGVISSFMQNVGAAALFLPVVSRISSRTGIAMSRLLMPMGFCAILGGTMTMVGSSPLILLNDLIISANQTLAADQQIQLFKLFDVTPIGGILILVGILYFVIAGRWLLPTHKQGELEPTNNAYEYFHRIYSLNPTVTEIIVPSDSPLVGKNIIDLARECNIEIIGIFFRGRTRMEPPADINVEAPARLAVIAEKSNLEAMVTRYDLSIDLDGSTFVEELSSDKSGVAELVIPPDSSLIGQSAKEIGIRKNYGLSILTLFRQGTPYGRTHARHPHHCDGDDTVGDVGQMPFQSGDTLVCHTTWDGLSQLEKQKDFVVVTTGYPRENFRPHKTSFALLFFGIALFLILFTDMRLSLCLLIGAVGMIISNVLSIDEAYKAISWKTIFLLASLIPLGQAVQATGTAQWIAQQIIHLVGSDSALTLQIVVAILATIFTLVMSNVGATVLLVPLAINIAIAADANPALFALTVAISTSNSFLIPTHQVNALIMGPGGYSVIDFIKVGGLMTLIFLIVSLMSINLFYG